MAGPTHRIKRQNPDLKRFTRKYALAKQAQAHTQKAKNNLLFVVVASPENDCPMNAKVSQKVSITYSTTLCGGIRNHSTLLIFAEAALFVRVMYLLPWKGYCSTLQPGVLSRGVTSNASQIESFKRAGKGSPDSIGDYFAFLHSFTIASQGS